MTEQDEVLLSYEKTSGGQRPRGRGSRDLAVNQMWDLKPFQ